MLRYSITEFKTYVKVGVCFPVYNIMQKKKNRKEDRRKLLKLTKRFMAQNEMMVSQIYTYLQTYQVVYIKYATLFICQFSSVQLLSHVRLCQLYLNKWVFQCHTFLPFHTFHGVLKARILSGLPFPSPADHLLSELSTMSHPPWVALQGMAHSFTELDKIVVHIISLVSFL